VSEPIAIRAARDEDLPVLTSIYNHFVENTAVTFELETWSVERRRQEWYAHYHEHGRHRLLVAEAEGEVIAYASSSPFHTRGGYDTSVEVSVYCAPERGGRGLGTRLYTVLFEALAGEDVHRAYAGIAPPNDASFALHRRFGFEPVAHFHEAGWKHGRYWDVHWLEKKLR